MHDFVELWVYLSATPLFGLTATLVAYVVAHGAYTRLGQPPWANPVLWTVVALALLLAATGMPYPTYFSGAQFIHFLLGPAVVALAGGTAAAGSAVAIGWAVGLPADVLASLAPKSVTAPVAMGIAAQLGGIPALAAVFAVLTGLVGAVSAKYLLDALRVSSPEIRGFALGTASHGVGAARAMQVHPASGAYAALALGLQVLLAALLMPIALMLFTFF